jgi:hypothetical protein
VRASPALDDVALCAGCHQFGPEAAVNGKPLENLVAEWAASDWARAGATCQSCHLPDGRHLFQGIHAPELVAASVEVRWTQTSAGTGALALTNSAVGHAFPSYATPRVVLSVQPEDARGRPVGAPATRVLQRQLRADAQGWHEDADTRVPPGQTARLDYALALPAEVARLHAAVRVEPDFGYVALDRQLLEQPGISPERRRDLQAAQEAAGRSGYLIFEEFRNVPPR